MQLNMMHPHVDDYSIERLVQLVLRHYDPAQAKITHTACPCFGCAVNSYQLLHHKLFGANDYLHIVILIVIAMTTFMAIE